MARILLGVSGGIAAYRALDFVRLATGAGHAVRVIQTPASLRFVGAASFAALTGAPVLTQEWERDPARGAFPDQTPPDHDPLSHLELVRNADAFLVAPATANTLAKLAAGLADNLLTSAALAADGPLVLAPAMNDHMWHHPATEENVRRLVERGAVVVPPGTGRLASKGEAGTGRLATPAELLAAVESVIEGQPNAPSGGRPWDGLRVLVSAGGTREPIDSVRFVGNRSSGRMGVALAEGAAARGADVTLVAANVGLPSSPQVRRLDVETAAQLQAALEGAFAETDVLLMAAAVADFRPALPADTKLKKDGRDGMTIELEPTPDILATLSDRRRAGQILVGFAAEHGTDAVALGTGKLERKRLDAVVVNDISRPEIGFDSPDNEVTILTAAGARGVALASKDAIASAVLDAVERLRAVLEAEPIDAVSLARRVREVVAGAVQVKPALIDDLLVCMLAEGHVLIEDLPGVGKTTLARAMSHAFALQFARIQCTVDLLPADVVGVSVFEREHERFVFRPGPIFANVVLVDEINRASPRTQSGLLECMQERRVTVDVHTHELARPFLVLATQNPVEFEGTYPLPEAQLDRFMARVSLGYPDAAGEAHMLARHETGDRVAEIEPVGTAAELLAAQDAAAQVHVSGALRAYVVSLLHRTREDRRTELGASPRAGLLLLRAAKARALLAGRDHVLPDDVQQLAATVVSHRIVLAPEAAGVTGADVITDALAATPAL